MASKKMWIFEIEVFLNPKNHEGNEKACLFIFLDGKVIRGSVTETWKQPVHIEAVTVREGGRNSCV